MLASDIFNMAKYSELKQLAIKDDVNAVLSFMNLGLIELYKRFRLSIKVEIVRTSPMVPMYYLRNTDIEQVVEVYDSNGKSLKEAVHTTDEDYDIKKLSPTVYLFKAPVDEEIAFVYTASPERIASLDDDLQIPTNMVEPLLHYIGYKGHAALDGNIDGENNTHYMRFEKSCLALIELGFGPVVELPYRDITTKGFI